MYIRTPSDLSGEPTKNSKPLTDAPKATRVGVRTHERTKSRSDSILQGRGCHQAMMLVRSSQQMHEREVIKKNTKDMGVPAETAESNCQLLQAWFGDRTSSVKTSFSRPFSSSVFVLFVPAGDAPCLGRFAFLFRSSCLPRFCTRRLLASPSGSITL